MPLFNTSSNTQGSRRGMRIPVRVVIAVLVVGFALVKYYSSSSTNPVTGATQHVSLTPSQERALGLQAAPEMIRQMGGLSRDAAAGERVQRVGMKIVNAMPSEYVQFAREYSFDYHLLADTQTVNAFALPGGQVFITEALYRKLQTEGQLAGVLGHETGHVLARHSAQQMAKGELTQGIVGGATVAASGSPDSARAAQAVAGMVGNMIMLKYGRSDELQADQLGVRLMVLAGYDPRAMIGVMQILDATSGGSARPEFTSTHPNPGNRIEHIKAELEKSFPRGVPGGLTP